MSETAQERTEKPTPKRREEARKRGQLPRSPELGAAAVTLIAGAGMYLLGGHLGGRMHGMMASSLQLTREEALDETRLVAAFADSALQGLIACAPVLGLTLVAAVLAPLALGGWNLSFGVLALDFSRLSPVAGFKRMFSLRGAVELAKAFAKFAVVALFAVLFLWHASEELLSLGREPVNRAIAHAFSLTGQALIAFAAALGLIAAVDVPWQLWQHTQKLRMTRQEIREELKETEGSPEIKSRIRAVQQELARRRMMQEVPRADVVVVNPTHYAVALRYDEQRMRAPTVVAKGVDEVAMRIRAIAEEHRVPILEAPPLARALHRSVDIGEEIPATLYVAVAQVLTYVYQLRAARRTGAQPPEPPRFDESIESVRH
nr:MAG: flagellar biosynthetic protein FlhB [Pseudomonadota bacterium]